MNFDSQPYAILKPKYASFEYKLAEGVMTISFNRAKSLNSMNMEYFFDLLHFFKALNSSLSKEDIRVVVMQSAIKDFSVGLDR